MKLKFLYTIFYLSSIFSLIKAQHYQTIFSNRIVTFMGSYDYVQFVRIDSVQQVDNDSVFYPNSNIREMDEQCYLPYGPSWIGSPIIIQQDGFNCFINKVGDTIRIKTDAIINESWIAYEKTDYLKIIGRVTGHNMQSFLGLTDSVKTIGFTVYNENNQHISHILNNKTLLLSKNYGLIRTLSFSLFPDMESEDFNWYLTLEELNIIGLSDPLLGVQNLTWFDVYDFQPGDEIHVYYESGCDGEWTIEKTKTKYLSRIDYPDTIVYEIEVEKNKTHTIFGEGSTTYHHNLRQVIILPNMIFDKLPGEPIFFDEGNAGKHDMVIDQHITKWQPSHSSRIEQYSDTCWDISWGWFGCLYDYSYYKGLGGPYYWCQSSVCIGGEERSLVFYKKGGTTWGTPLVITGLSDQSDMNPIRILPNPTKDIININLPESNIPCTLEIIDLNGQTVFSAKIFQKETLINIEQIHSGIYFYKLIRNQEILSIGKLSKI